MAQCLPFVEKLADGWNTMIGENGCELSGGERQRISIARAFLKDSPIILLDEATASLDAENETEIQKALSKLIRNKTVLVIAHRMRTVENADKIVVLSGGHVAEEGCPEHIWLPCRKKAASGRSEHLNILGAICILWVAPNLHSCPQFLSKFIFSHTVSIYFLCISI